MKTPTTPTDDDDGDEEVQAAAQPTEDSGVHASSDAVPVSEKFQQATHKLTSKANKHHLSHMRSKINDREDQLREEEMSKKGKKPTPDTFTAEDMPN